MSVSADQEERNSHNVGAPRGTLAADDQESSSRTRHLTIGAAAVIPALLIGVLTSTHPGAPQDSGLVACAYPLSTQDVPATDYPKIRAEFACSRWPDLRNAGTAYIDLAVAAAHCAWYRRIPDRLVLPAAVRHLRKARTRNASSWQNCHATVLLLSGPPRFSIPGGHVFTIAPPG